MCVRTIRCVFLSALSSCNLIIISERPCVVCNIVCWMQTLRVDRLAVAVTSLQFAKLGTLIHLSTCEPPATRNPRWLSNNMNSPWWCFLTRIILIALSWFLPSLLVTATWELGLIRSCTKLLAWHGSKAGWSRVYHQTHSECCVQNHEDHGHHYHRPLQNVGIHCQDVRDQPRWSHGKLGAQLCCPKVWHATCIFVMCIAAESPRLSWLGSLLQEIVKEQDHLGWKGSRLHRSAASDWIESLQPSTALCNVDDWENVLTCLQWPLQEDQADTQPGWTTHTPWLASVSHCWPAQRMRSSPWLSLWAHPRRQWPCGC